eukprot:gene31612-41044_t
MLLVTPYAYSSPTLLGFGVSNDKGNFVNSIQYETLTQNQDFLGSRVSKVEQNIDSFLDVTKGSLLTSINTFKSDIDALVQDNINEFTEKLSAQRQEMENMNRSSKIKLATFAQAVSELSNTVHLNISNKIVHLQQDMSELERTLQRSLLSGDASANISSLEAKLSHQRDVFNGFNESIHNSLVQLTATVDSSIHHLESKIQSNFQEHAKLFSEIVVSLEQQLLKNISAVKDSLTEQSNNSSASARAIQEVFDQKFLQISANYSNLTSQVTAEIAALSDTLHVKNTALNNSLSEISMHTDTSHQQMKKELQQEQKAVGDKISSLSTEIVVLKSQQESIRTLQVEQKAQHADLQSLQSSQQLEVGKLSSKVQEQGQTMAVLVRDSTTLQQSVKDKGDKIDKLEKEIEEAKRSELDLEREAKRNISSWTERQADKDASAGKELASLRSQVAELLAAVTAATAKISAMEKEQGQWKTRLESDSKEQKKLLEDKVDKLDKVVQAKVISLAVAEAQLQSQGQELRAMKAQRDKDRDREVEKERESILKEKGKNNADQYATKESVEKLRTLVWDLQSGLLTQSGKAMELLMKGWKKD